MPDGRVRCDLCPRFCTMKEGQRGFCFVRGVQDGRVELTSYGRASGFCIDPIEKKPLNHFLPGTSVLSFGTAGCNLGCRFCQNHDISKAREMETLADRALPDGIAEAAAESGCRSVAYTYNDPVIFAEYAIDTAHACRERGIASVAVSAGYITEHAREAFFGAMDAANIDLKAFTEDFYRKLTFSELAPVLETLKWLKHESSVWLEITTLLIPGRNDSEGEIAELVEWIAQELGDEVPLHFSGFHPDFKMRNVPATPASTLIRARQQALARGAQARLHRQRARPGGPVDLLRRLRRAAHRARLVLARRLEARRARPMQRVRPPARRQDRKRAGHLGPATPSALHPGLKRRSRSASTGALTLQAHEVPGRGARSASPDPSTVSSCAPRTPCSGSEGRIGTGKRGTQHGFASLRASLGVSIRGWQSAQAGRSSRNASSTGWSERNPSMTAPPGP